MLNFLLGFYIFIIGTALGSFLNVIAFRLPLKLSLWGRSHCEKCHRKIAWYDLIPIFSFIWLGGQCRYCRSQISIIHPLFEIITGISTLIWFFQASWIISFNSLLVLALILIALTLALSDYYYQIIPDHFLLIMLFLALFLNYSDLQLYLIGAILGAFAFWLLHYLSRGQAMGFGDVKYVFVMGLVLSWTSLLWAVYLAFLTGGLLSIILIVLKKKKMKSTISFGPFLSLGLIIALCFLI